MGGDRVTICLTEGRCEDFHGFPFINLDDDAAGMDEWFPGMREEVAEFVPQIGALAPLDRVEAPEACDWKVSDEKYSERCH